MKGTLIVVLMFVGLIVFCILPPLIIHFMLGIASLTRRLLAMARAGASHIRRTNGHAQDSATNVPEPAPVSIPAPEPFPARASMSELAAAVDGVEQLPQYEPLPPLPPYERIAKAGKQRAVEMRDLERGEPSGAASRSGDPPEYQAVSYTNGGDERVSANRVDTDGSHVGEPPPPAVPAVLYVRRVFGGFGPCSR